MARSTRQLIDRVRRMAYRTTLGPSRPDERRQDTFPLPGTRRDR
jgi:hypothetical protein